MTAVLAAAARFVLGAVLVLACAAAALWAGAYGPRAWTLAWLVAVPVVVACAVLAWTALQPEGGRR